MPPGIVRSFLLNPLERGLDDVTSSFCAWDTKPDKRTRRTSLCNEDMPYEKASSARTLDAQNESLCRRPCAAPCAHVSVTA